jgi:hypothetical protein
MNFYPILVAALVPLLVGFIWYHPSVFGKSWMQDTGIDMQDAKEMNMGKVFGITALLALMLAVALMPMVVHQMHVGSLLANDGEAGKKIADDFLAPYLNNFRTFKHGAFHGLLGAIFIVLPIVGTTSVYERKSFRYVMITFGYWAVCMSIMGGIISAWK